MMRTLRLVLWRQTPPTTETERCVFGWFRGRRRRRFHRRRRRELVLTFWRGEDDIKNPPRSSRESSFLHRRRLQSFVVERGRGRRRQRGGWNRVGVHVRFVCVSLFCLLAKKKKNSFLWLSKNLKKKGERDFYASSPGKWTYKSPYLGYRKKTQNSANRSSRFIHSPLN